MALHVYCAFSSIVTQIIDWRSNWVSIWFQTTIFMQTWIYFKTKSSKYAACCERYRSWNTETQSINWLFWEKSTGNFLHNSSWTKLRKLSLQSIMLQKWKMVVFVYCVLSFNLFTADMSSCKIQPRFLVSHTSMYIFFSNSRKNCLLLCIKLPSVRTLSSKY